MFLDINHKCFRTYVEFLQEENAYQEKVELERGE